MTNTDLLKINHGLLVTLLLLEVIPSTFAAKQMYLAIQRRIPYIDWNLTLDRGVIAYVR